MVSDMQVNFISGQALQTRNQNDSRLLAGTTERLMTVEQGLQNLSKNDFLTQSNDPSNVRAE